MHNHQWAWTLILTILILDPSTAAPAASPPGTASRRVPPPGLAIKERDRRELEEGVAALGKELDSLRSSSVRVVVASPGADQSRASSIPVTMLLPDVEIYHKAVDWALRYDEFYRNNEVRLAKVLLDHGLDRARALRQGQAPWITATGLVVRGYVSKIDGSVQPYGLVVPASWSRSNPSPRRLDVWLHGRDDRLTELKFIAERERSQGPFTPPDTFVLHPYGRFCNAFKFAGEMDVFEALNHARAQYPIDKRRISIRGFSMGGAGTWHLAAHYSGFWAAAAPGAGFAETAVYTGILGKEPALPWYQQRLWHLYDATDYALNLFNCPTLAYSGEIDKQKQAADIMAQAMRKEGLNLTHLIGPGTAHRYEPKTKEELSRRFDRLMAPGQHPVPKEIRFTTWTLRYNQCEWITVEGLEHHWERARIEARLVDDGNVEVATTNVTALTLSPPTLKRDLKVSLDGETLEIPEESGTDRAPALSFYRSGSTWKLGKEKETHAKKRHGLQGPIDDAFLDSFLMVLPTGKPFSRELGDWVSQELADATNQWRAQFRGDAPLKTDVEINDEDLARYHLILWGDPASNRVLAKIADRLPIRWNNGALRVGTTSYSSPAFVPILICPNPLNPKRYVVLNSGFTFSASGHLSNALQTPKLPDWAVIDSHVPRAQRFEKGIRAAGFFDEQWQLPSP